MEPKQEDSEKIFQKGTNVEGSSYKLQVASFKSQVCGGAEKQRTRESCQAPTGRWNIARGEIPVGDAAPGRESSHILSPNGATAETITVFNRN